MNINDTLQAFELKGTDDKMHHTNDFADKKVLVIIITCNHCPYAQAYIKRIANLVDTYKDRAAIIALNGNDVVRYPADSFENMKPMADLLHLDGLYLWDENQEVLEYMRAERTPEVYAFNAERKLVYQGAFDDNYESEAAVTKHYLKDAIDAVLNDSEVSIKQTPAIGCSVKWKSVPL